MAKDTAVTMLKGHTLEDGWKVIDRVKFNEDHTGGYFSVAYLAEREGKQGFLKAFDFSKAFEAKNTADALRDLTSAYTYERELLSYCNEKKLRKVVVALGHGQFQVPAIKGIEGLVFYLIFELADGDVRGQVRADNRFDCVWCLNALHDVAVGLFQLHQNMIAHQDMKPSNVLIFNLPSKQECRIGDLGRSSRKGYVAIHDAFNCPGARSYSPPELLYGYRDNEEFARMRVGCDLYMFGNLAAFLLTGINVTSSIIDKLDKQHRPENWMGTYADALPYVTGAYAEVMREIRKQIDKAAGDEIAAMIEQLCNPDLARRGDPRRIGRPDQYSLQRIISSLDRIRKFAAMRVRSSKKSA